MFDALHNLKGGQYAIVALVVQIIVAGMGGFLFNAQTVTSCNTDFTYITDVYGAFKGSDQDIEVEYNPVENVTGYSVRNPMEPVTVNYNVTGINYTTTTPNQYPIKHFSGDQTIDEFDLSSSKDPEDASMQDSYPISATYKGTTVTGIKELGVFGHYGQGDTVSREYPATCINVNGTTYWCTQGVNMYALINALHIKTNVYFTTSNVNYPQIIAGMTVSSEWGRAPGDSTYHTRMIHTIGYSDISNEGYVDIQGGTITINERVYPLSDTYLVWGNEGSAAEVGTILDTGSTNMFDYINPADGVSPIATQGEQVIIVTEETTSYRAGGTIGYQGADGQVTGIEVHGNIVLQDQSPFPFYQVPYTFNIVYESHVAHAYLTVDGQQYQWDEDQGGAQFERSSAYFTFVWEREYLTFWKTEKQIDMTNPSISSPDFLVRLDVPNHNPDYATPGITIESTGQSSGRYTGWFNLIDGQYPIRSYQMEFTEADADSQVLVGDMTGEVTHTERITLDFEHTYWNNGYSVSQFDLMVDTTGASGTGNVIAMAFALDFRKDGVTAPRWTNEDVGYIFMTRNGDYVYITQGTQYDPDISHWTNLGSFDHCMIELAVKDGKVSLWIEPIYDWRTFLDYKSSGYMISSPVYQDRIDASGVVAQYGEIKAIRYIDYWTKAGGETSQPRHLITSTTVFLSEGGLYKQDGVLSFNERFPQDAISELVISAVVRPGDELILSTGGVPFFTLENDGVSKWVYNNQKYDWYDVKFFYLSNHIPGITIEGEYYGPGMYYNGVKLDENSAYAQFGKYQAPVKVGQLQNGDLAVTMKGVWAFTTQYSVGENVQGTHTEIGTPGQWDWSQQEFLVIFIGVMIGSLAIMTWKFGVRWLDLAIGIGQMAICWVMLG